MAKEGIKSFEMGRVTCLSTDWSKTGVAFVLMQKYCSCKGINLKCCKEGWRLCYTGSRFTSGAESRYAPIEGEALGVAWSLGKCKHFITGMDLGLFYIGVDHKPLLGIYHPDRALGDIGNNRLRNLAEKAARYRFTTFHI